MKGLWKLRGSSPPLYTNKAADIIIHKPTGKEYLRGERVLFGEGNLPTTVESTGEYEFIYVTNKAKRGDMTEAEMLREIHVNTMLKKLTEEV